MSMDYIGDLAIVYEDAFLEIEDDDLDIQMHLASRHAVRELATKVIRDVMDGLDQRLAGDLPTCIWNGFDLMEALDSWLNERGLDVSDPTENES